MRSQMRERERAEEARGGEEAAVDVCDEVEAVAEEEGMGIDVDEGGGEAIPLSLKLREAIRVVTLQVCLLIS